MAQSRSYKILSRIVEIKPGEEKIAIFLFSYFFLITSSYTIIKSLRVAGFLDTLGANKIPVARLLGAILMGFVVALHSKLQIKTPRHLLIIFSLIFFSSTGFLFWFFFPYKWNWLPLACWIWADVFVAVLMTQFWIAVNDLFNPREVKRLVGFFGSGGILGGIFGGELTGLLAKSNVDTNFLLVASGLLIICAFVVHSLFIWQRKNEEASSTLQREAIGRREEVSQVGFRDCFDTVRRNTYLKLIAAGVALTLVVSTFIDWQFSFIVQNASAVKNNLTSFFGHFNAGLLVFSFFLQILLTSRLIQNYGVRFSLLLYPFILLCCSMGIAIVPLNFYFALIIKSSDKSLSYSINQSVRELLYIPISPEIKYKAKIFIDMFLNRFSKGFGAVLLIILLYFNAGVRLVSFVSAILILGWIILNLKVTREYANTVKQKLQMKWDRADKIVAEKLDVDYTKLVFDTLESRNRSSVLYAMHLFDLIKQEKLTPEVKRLISYKSDELKVSSLGTLFEEEAATVPEWDDSIAEESLKKDVAEIMSLDAYQKVMKGYVQKVLAEKGLETETAKMEVAKAIGMMDPHSPLAEELERLLEDESAEVSRLAMESAGKLVQKEHVPAIIQKLQSPLTREDASLALEKYGSKIVGTLSDYLGDEEEEIELRKAVAAVLSRVASQEATDFLMLELLEAKVNLDREIIDALDRIRSLKPDVQFEGEMVRLELNREVKKRCEIFLNFYSKAELEKEKRKALEKELSFSLINIFKLLGLIYSREDIGRAYQNMKAGTKESVAYALELLDNTLKKEDKDLLLPLLEDLPLEEKARRCQNLLRALAEG